MDLQADVHTGRRYTHYGGRAVVSAVDHRMVARHRARDNPMITVGYWSNYAELAVMTGYAAYDIHNVENQDAITRRLRAGNADRIMRTRFLRIAFEEWKYSAGIMEAIGWPDRMILSVVTGHNL